MISNIYSWIFPSAVFAAAGLSNLSSSVKHKRNPDRARRNRIIWFSINISLALGFLMVSAFIIDWSEVIWSRNHLYFGLSVLCVFYLSFMFKFIIGIPLILFFTTIILFLNVYIQDWNPVPSGEVVARFRVLSNDQRGIRAEIQGKKLPVVFIEGEGSSIDLGFEYLIINRTLFFMSSDKYNKMIIPSSEVGGLKISDKIISRVADNTFFLSRNIYNITIGEQALLHLYDIVIDSDQKNIYIEN